MFAEINDKAFARAFRQKMSSGYNNIGARAGNPGVDPLIGSNDFNEPKTVAACKIQQRVFING